MKRTKKVYALLVGINDYDQIKKLRGCLNDIEAVEKYLQLGTDFEVSVEKLTNAQATRAGIIAAFRSHLAQAGKEDTVLFYYSGHGTQEAADPMWEETDGALECIVCYDGGASKTADFLLTDKELRYLLKELYQATQAHVVTIFDCCHSGDNTRNGALMLAGDRERSERRITDKGGKYFPQREWKDFLFSEAIREEQTQGQSPNVFLPQGLHIQLAACESNQVALEETMTGRREGVFTKTLLKTLKDCGGNLSYNTLRSRIRQYMRTSYEQTPRIYAPIEAASLLSSGFLNRMVDLQKLLAEATQNDQGQWQLNVGAIHGVKNDSPITLFDPMNLKAKIIANAKENGVFIDYTLIEADDLNQGTVYKAEVKGLLAQTLKIELQNRDATPEEANELLSLLEKRAGGGFSFGGELGAKPTEKDSGVPETADYSLHLNSGEAYVTFPGDSYRPLIRPISFVEPEDYQEIAASLQHISRWHFIKGLQHEKIPEGFPAQPLKLELSSITADNTFTPLDTSTGMASLVYEKAGEDWQGSIQIKITNTTGQNLYVCAAYLSKEFECFLDFLPQRVHLLERNASICLGNTTKAGEKKDIIKLKLGKVDQEYNWPLRNEAIKFIISTTEFNAEALTLGKLPQPYTTEGDRAGETEKSLVTEEDDPVQFSGWITQTLQLRSINPVFNRIPTQTLQALLSLEKTAYFASGLYCDIERDKFGQPTVWKLKKGIVIPEEEKGLFDDVKLWLGNQIETIQRRKRYNNLKKDPTRLRIVAEGDSWFQYPILLLDTLDQLYKRYAIRSFAEAGDTLANYLKKKEYLRAIGEESADIFLVSGGGNDVLGEEFQHFLRDKPDKEDTTPKRYLNQTFFNQLDTLENLYSEMFSELLTSYPDLHMLVHCYDYIIPVDKRKDQDKFSWSGKYMVEKKIEPQAERENLIRYIVDQFATRVQSVTQQDEFQGKVSFIDTRGLIDRNHWFDEIHPINEGFELVAGKFIEEIERIKAEKKSLFNELIQPGNTLYRTQVEKLLLYNKAGSNKRIVIKGHSLDIHHIRDVLASEETNLCFGVEVEQGSRLILKPKGAEKAGMTSEGPEGLFPIEELTSTSMKPGQMDYQIPDVMVEGKATTCTIRIGDLEVKDISISPISTHSSIQISDEMSVKLIDLSGGENFKIVPITTERQGIEKGKYTEWKISVMPLQKGAFPLSLRVSCHFNGKTKDVEVLEKLIVTSDEPTTQRKKIAFIAAGAKSGLLLGKESNEIWEELMLSPYRDDYTFVKYFEVSNLQFNRALSFEKPSIVHFSGHGCLDGIFLADDQGEPKFIRAEEVASIFKVLKSDNTIGLECVVLNACLSRNLAKELFGIGLTVIGTNDNIGDEKAIKFSEFFYRSLGNRQTYQQAFKAGRLVVNEKEDGIDALEDLLICLPPLNDI